MLSMAMLPITAPEASSSASVGMPGAAPVGPYEGDGREALWMIASCLGPRAALEESPSALGNESAEPITLVSGTQASVRPGSRSSANSGRVSAGKILKAEYDCDRATAH